MAIILTGFEGDEDYLDERVNVFCNGYHDQGMHVGVAISASHPNVYAIYGSKPTPHAHYCTPQQAGCATFSFFMAYELLASRLSPSGGLIVSTASYGTRTLINRWRRGELDPPRGYDRRGKELDEVARLTHERSLQISVRYVSTRQFKDTSRLLELRTGMLNVLSTL